MKICIKSMRVLLEFKMKLVYMHFICMVINNYS